MRKLNRRWRLRYSAAAIVTGFALIGLSRGLVQADAVTAMSSTQIGLILVLSVFGGFLLMMGLMTFIFVLASK